MLVFEVNYGEMMKSLTAQAEAAEITDAAIVSLIGGVDRFTISTMPADDATKDIVSNYALPAEMHGSGEIRDGKVHVHATMAVQGDRAIAGHVHEAHIGTWFARAYVIPRPARDQ
ncbi:PCC domain-containing protein [Nocardia sp. NBC_01009]|uniref:PCC domain-containing protein n=1 Tax=Nocardia sp. NBC_01009 TaxID=2975996 RepID=UPI003863FDB6|nr:DNA-binding protein [Nocardia sp. NBC_01009]